MKDMGLCLCMDSNYLPLKSSTFKNVLSSSSILIWTAAWHKWLSRLSMSSKFCKQSWHVCLLLSRQLLSTWLLSMQLLSTWLLSMHVPSFKCRLSEELLTNWRWHNGHWGTVGSSSILERFDSTRNCNFDREK